MTNDTHYNLQPRSLVIFILQYTHRKPEVKS